MVGAPSQMRLNRYLARAGIASRRKCDLLIRQGAITVNGEVVEDAGRSVAVGRDRVQIEGRSVFPPRAFEYLIINKPEGCLVTRTDTHGRPTVFAKVRDLRAGTVAVGRLDQDTTGLLLLTDDGELAHRLMHPRFGVDKVYVVTVRGEPSAAQLDQLRRGIVLDDGVTSPAGVRLLRQRRSGSDPAADSNRGPGSVRGRESKQRRVSETRLEICIREGRKRQIRRMVAAIGHPTRALQRVEYAGLPLAELKLGESRRLRAGEVAKIRTLVGL